MNALYESHMRLWKCPRVKIYGGVLILVCVRVLIHGCKCACGLVWHTPAAVTTATPPDTENKRKVIENYLHKTGECTISQTPQPEGA